MKTQSKSRAAVAVAMCWWSLVAACSDEHTEHTEHTEHAKHTGHDEHAEHTNGPNGAAAVDRPLTNRLAVPAAVRSNLGIRFAKAEQRTVQRTLSLPGRFELNATATRSHPALLAGPVELHVQRLQRVVKGQLLATLRPPALRERQHELHKAEHDVRRGSEQLTVAVAELQANKRRIAFLQKRIKHLGAAGVTRASLDGQLLSLRDALPAATARVLAVKAEVSRERHHKRVLLLALSEVSGRSVAALVARVSHNEANNNEADNNEASNDKKPPEEDAHEHHTKPLWDSLSSLQVRARSAGIVTAIGVKQGGWAPQGASLVEVTDDTSLRFVGRALQSDIGRLEQGAAASIVPPAGVATVRRGETPKRGSLVAATGTISLGVDVSAGDRTLPIVVTTAHTPVWARAGLSTVVEVVVSGTSEPEIAVPRAAVVRDGLADVLFVRDKADPDKVIRVQPELGPDNGSWIVVYSDVNTGDEVVVDGAYELKLASGRKPTVKGHFHADGTFHAAKEHP